MSFLVERPGLLTTVQDGGRPGHQAEGVTPGGAMDLVALRVANMLVGNPPLAPALEVTLLGPRLRFETAAVIAVAGGDLGAAVASVSLPAGRVARVEPGDVVTFAGHEPGRGARAYLAIAGGISVPTVLGGCGTDLRAAIGGVGGRALQAGDAVPVGSPGPRGHVLLERLRACGRRVTSWGAPALLPVARLHDPVVRITRGLEWEWLSGVAHRAFGTAPWQVTARSDRMGLRLAGPPIAPEPPREMVSSPVATGTVQVPPGGAPIILMADRQTVGGYPRIAQVAEVDLSLMAQLAPGEYVRFHEVSLEEATAHRVARDRALHDLGVGLAALDR